MSYLIDGPFLRLSDDVFIYTYSKNVWQNRKQKITLKYAADI
jgi:hypothetical protein